MFEGSMEYFGAFWGIFEGYSFCHKKEASQKKTIADNLLIYIPTDTFLPIVGRVYPIAI